MITNHGLAEVRSLHGTFVKLDEQGAHNVRKYDEIFPPTWFQEHSGEEPPPPVISPFWCLWSYLLTQSKLRMVTLLQLSRPC